MSSYSNELLFALEVCKQAGEIAMNYLRQGIGASLKPDGTQVTKADKECEQMIRQKIAERYPTDGVLGEEEHEKKASGSNKRRWILDPIDGTVNYARRIPIFSQLLALENDNEIVLGVVHAPALQDTYWAESGQGAYKNGVKIRVSTVNTVAQSYFVFGGLDRILRSRWKEGFFQVVEKTYEQRGFGDCLGFGLVFEGKVEAMLEVNVNPWDVAPMKILVEEAGGKFTDLRGGSSIYNRDCLVSNGLVHESIENLLQKP